MVQKKGQQKADLESAQIKKSLEDLTEIGEANRIYLQDGNYYDVTGNKIVTTPLEQHLLEISSSRELGKLNQLVEVGRSLRANYFSLSESCSVNRYSVYAVLFHRKSNA